MPHSSGGGSSSGGSHGGSSGPHISHNRYAGSHRYARYKSDGNIEYSYCDTDISRQPKGINFFGIIIAIPFIFFSGIIFLQGLIPPDKIDTSSYEATVFVSDGCDVIDNEVYLGHRLDDFKELTGISIGVETLYDNQWERSFYDLEDYAYDEYLRIYDDEKHWLLVYSEDENNSSKWAWEGMQGDDTDPVLTENFADKFTQKVQKELKKGASFDEAIESGLDLISKNIMTGPRYDQLFGAVFMIAMIVACVYFVCIYNRTGNRTSYIRVEDEGELKKIKCPLCGKFYIKGTVPVCPFCFDVKKYNRSKSYRAKVDEQLSNYPVYEVDNDDPNVF